MKYSIVTGPTLEPVSLSEMKARARVTDSASDGILAGYILEARQWVESVAGLLLMQQTVDAYYDSFGDVLELPKSPVQSITSVSYVDTAGTTQTLSSSYYLLNQRDRVPAVELATGYTWPTTQERSNAITVRFVGGYGSTQSLVPEPVRGAVMLYARFLLDGEESDYTAATRLLEPFRVHRA